MSYGTSDTAVISPLKTEAHNLNNTEVSAAQRDDSSPAPKNRQEDMSVCLQMQVTFRIVISEVIVMMDCTTLHVNVLLDISMV